jgi:ABC-type sugar transport system substrate-binding protein
VLDILSIVLVTAVTEAASHDGRVRPRRLNGGDLVRSRIRGLVAASTAVGMALALAACGGDDGGSGSDGGSGGTQNAADDEGGGGGGGSDGVGCDEAQGAVVGYSEPLPDPNFQFIERIMAQALGEYGAELRPVNANLDPGKQVADINTLVQSGVDVLIANPIDPNATLPAFDRARAQGIPVIAQETTVGGPFFTNVTADVESAAAQGAQLLADTVGDGGQVAALNGPSFAEVIVRENEAFAAAAEEAGLEVVDTQVNQQITPQGAQAIAQAWRDRYGADLAGVWTFNDTSAVGVASAFSGSDERPAIVSINGQPEVIPLIESGEVLATFDIRQDKLGQALAYAALGAICGTEVPEEIVVPVQLIDQSNAGEYRTLEERVEDPFEVTFEERDGRTYLAD